MKNKRLKVAHVVLNLDMGGLETMVVDLVKGLDKKIFDPIVICLRHPGQFAKELEAAGISVLALRNRDRLEWRSFFQLAGILINRKIDIVHCHNTAGYFYGGIGAVLAGFKRIIYTEHGRIFPDTPRRMLAEKILSIFTDRIVAVSKDMKNCLIRYEGIDPLRIQVVHNGIDIDKFRKIDNGSWRAAKRKTLGIGENDVVIGNVARLDPVKDHATLLKAMTLLLAKDKGLRIKDEKSFKLLIIGDGPEFDNIKDLCGSLSLDFVDLKGFDLSSIIPALPAGRHHRSSVVFTGARSDIPELMNIMDVFVLSSRNEGISLTLLEAMSCGVPVVATKVGGNPEIVMDGANGFLVKAGDFEEMAGKIVRLIESPLPVQTRSNHISVQMMIKQYQHLYLEPGLSFQEMLNE